MTTMRPLIRILCAAIARRGETLRDVSSQWSSGASTEGEGEASQRSTSQVRVPRPPRLARRRAPILRAGPRAARRGEPSDVRRTDSGQQVVPGPDACLVVGDSHRRDGPRYARASRQSPRRHVSREVRGTPRRPPPPGSPPCRRSAPRARVTGRSHVRAIIIPQVRTRACSAADVRSSAARCGALAALRTSHVGIGSGSSAPVSLITRTRASVDRQRPAMDRGGMQRQTKTTTPKHVTLSTAVKAGYTGPFDPNARQACLTACGSDMSCVAKCNAG